MRALPFTIDIMKYFPLLSLIFLIATAQAQPAADPGGAHVGEADAGEHPPTTTQPHADAEARSGAEASGIPATQPQPDPAQDLPLLDASEHLFPFVPPWDDASDSPINVSFLNHIPAGKFGPVTAGEDGELYIGEGDDHQRIKFLGTNLNFASIYPEHDDADKVAGRIAKFGFNVVRFHHTDTHTFPRGIWAPKEGDSDKPSSTIDPRSLDRLHYFVAALKKHGIYSNINLMVNRRFNDDPSLGDSINEVPGGKPRLVIGYWHEPHRDLQKEYAKALLTAENPHTGLSLAEDPAVAFVEIINEHGLVNYFFMERYEPELAEMPEPFLSDLTRQWGRYLHEKHQWDYLSVVHVYGDGERLFVPTLQQFREGWNPTQRRTWIEFLYQKEIDYYADMRKYLREDLGVKALIMGSTAGSSTPLIMAQSTDVIDQHVYYDNPKWRGKTWDFGSKDWHIDNTSNIGGYVGGRLRWVAGYQVEGKPFSVTEYNTAAPNMFAGEAPLYLATMGAIQGWDAIYLFAYTHNAEWDRHRIIGLDTADHPTKMANVPIAALLFRRGDLATPETATRVEVTPSMEVGVIAEKGSGWSLSNAYYFGAEGEKSVLRPIRIVPAGDELDRELFPPDRGEAEIEDIKQREEFISESGELIWNRHDRDASYVKINTPRTKSFYGTVTGPTFVFRDPDRETGGVTLKLEPTTTGGGTMSLSLIEGESFADQPGRAILVATARAENTGMKWKRVQTKKGIGWELESWGTTPTLVEAVSGTVGVDTHDSRLRVYALDERGQRGEEVEVWRDKGDTNTRFRIGPPHRTLWYEVLWERGE